MPPILKFIGSKYTESASTNSYMEKIDSQLVLKTSSIQHGSVTPVYCSKAYSRFLTHLMQKKHWLGADLIFDIDAKDLHLPCELGHSYFIFTRCSEVSSAKSEVRESCKSKSLNQHPSLKTRFETYQRLISSITH